MNTNARFSEAEDNLLKAYGLAKVLQRCNELEDLDEYHKECVLWALTDLMDEAINILYDTDFSPEIVNMPKHRAKNKETVQ